MSSKEGDMLAKWTFTYGNLYVNIGLENFKNTSIDTLLIAGYLHYLGRYFFICDENQINVMLKFMHKAIQEKTNAHELAGKIYEKIFTTFNEEEKNAINKLFFFHFPPLSYSENKKFIDLELTNLGKVNQGNRSFAKYILILLERGGDILSSFEMPHSPLKILLPITIGVFYQYAKDKIEDTRNKNRLDQLIIELLDTFDFVGPQSSEAITLPTLLLKRRNFS